MSMRALLIVASVAVAGCAAVGILAEQGAVPKGLARAAHDIADVNLYPSTPGWLDRSGPLSQADRDRLAELRGIGRDDAGQVIRILQTGARSDLSRYDFELLRQDRRRAMAAYPDVDPDRLLTGRWFAVAYADKVPEDFCGGNASTTAEGPGATRYLDGPCFMAMVAAEFPDRTDGPAATRFLEERRAKQRAEREARMAVEGYRVARAGSGGSLSIDCKAGGKCVVERAEEWAKRGKRWTFGFVPSEWAGTFTYWAYDSLPSFRNAVMEEIDVEPSGVSSSNVVGTVGETKDVHGTVSPVAPPPPVPQQGGGGGGAHLPPASVRVPGSP